MDRAARRRRRRRLAAADVVLVTHKASPGATGQLRPAPAAWHHSATVTGRQRQQASGQWTASKLVITLTHSAR